MKKKKKSCVTYVIYLSFKYKIKNIEVTSFKSDDSIIFAWGVGGGGWSIRR